MSWAGLRGAVPIVLTTIPLAEDVARRRGALRHRLRDGGDLHPGHRSDAALGRRPARGHRARRAPATSTSRPRRSSGSRPTCCRSRITGRSLLHGVEVGELRLPVGASVSLVVRDGKTLVPEQRTVLRRGDDLLVVTPRRLREATEERLRAVSNRGRLAHWLDSPDGR